MKKILKTAVMTMLLTMCFGLTSLAAESSNTSNTAAVQQILNSQAAETTVAATTTSAGTQVSFTMQPVSVATHNAATQTAASVLADAGRQQVPGSVVLTVDVIPSVQPDGSVSITLKNSNIKAGRSYIVLHYNGSAWDTQYVTGGDGELSASFDSFSPICVVEYQDIPETTNFDKDLNNSISSTAEGEEIRITKNDGRTSLSLDMVKQIVSRNLTLVMEYRYNGVDYRIVIPGKAAVIDESVPIYGPLYLAAHYSSGAVAGGSSNSVTYTISKGDTLSKIAAANGTTVAALAALNPSITDVNVIYTGQSINLK